jgi:hypothetical protein
VHAAGNVTNADPHFVLGAGYTGMTAATGLARRTRNHDVTVRLVNPAARFTERLRLHQVASGQPLAELQIPDMLAGPGVDFVQGWVTAIDTGTRAVRVDDHRILHYDTLVYAMHRRRHGAGARQMRTPTRWTACRMRSCSRRRCVAPMREPSRSSVVGSPGWKRRPRSPSSTVQDARFRWSAADRSKVDNPKAYLAGIASNIALDRLRFARYQRETCVGPWLPEPILTRPDTSGDVDIAESVSMAMLMVLETLSPLERCSSSRRSSTIRTPRSPGPPTGPRQRCARPRAAPAGMCRPGGLGLLRTGKRCRPQPSGSFAAATGADINVLMELLAPDVTLWTDGGGKVRQAMRPIDGAAKVAASFTGALRRPTKGSGSQA